MEQRWLCSTWGSVLHHCGHQVCHVTFVGSHDPHVHHVTLCKITWSHVHRVTAVQDHMISTRIMRLMYKIMWSHVHHVTAVQDHVTPCASCDYFRNILLQLMLDVMRWITGSESLQSLEIETLTQAASVLATELWQPGNHQPSLGQAWASPTLARLHCTCVCVYVLVCLLACLWPYTVNFKWVNLFN